MKLNEERIKAKVVKAIAIKPTHITLMRKGLVSNGMRGSTEKEVKVAELDIFFDDSKHNLLLDNIREAGRVNRTRGISMIAVADFEIKEGDYFTIDSNKYRVIYPATIVKDVYNADLEVVT